MKIDIIIPVYNVNKYIGECIESILKIDNINILLINDGSQEDVSWVREKYKFYSNFHYYEKENGGLSSARNFGLEKSTSEYIMFLDGDDYLEKEDFIKGINQIKKSKKICYFFSFKYYYEKEKFFQKEDLQFKEKKNLLNEILNKKDFLMVAWRYIIKRDFLLEKNMFFKEGIYHEDEEWTTRLLCELDTIEYLPYYIYIYRQRENSITSNYRYKHLEDIIEIIKSLNKYKKKIVDKKKSEFILRKIYSLYLIILQRKSKINLNNEEKLLLKKKLKTLNLSFSRNRKHLVIKLLPNFLIELVLKKLK